MFTTLMRINDGRRTKILTQCNRCFKNVSTGYLPKSGFLRFSKKAERLK